MFSYEERLKAVKLYLKYNSWMAVINELGYPTVNALREWVKEYKQKGDLHSNSIRTPMSYANIVLPLGRTFAHNQQCIPIRNLNSTY